MFDRRRGLLLGAAFLLAQCSSESAPATAPCVVGASQACACIDGRTGAQTCNGAGFDPCVCGGTPDGGADAADIGADTTTPPTDTATTPPTDTGGIDAPVDTGTDPGCGGILDTHPDVYVDVGAAAGGKGGKTCAFKDIKTGLAQPLKGGVKRTVWVAAGTYLEAGLDVPTGVTLAGVGAATYVSGTALCPEKGYAGDGNDNCTIFVRNGGAVQGLKVNSTLAGASGCAGGVGASGASISLRDIEINKASSYALVGNGPVDAINVTVRGGSGFGVLFRGTGVARIRSEAPGSSLIENVSTASGIVVKQFVDLRLEGVVLQKNKSGGLTINSDNSVGPRSHEVTNCQFLDNCISTPSPGNCHALDLWYATASLKVRGSTFQRNVGTAMRVYPSTTTKIDLGTSADPGNNVFGGATTKDRNCVGVFGMATGASGSIPAVGNAWAFCPPFQNTSASCSLYSDIEYSGPAVNPFDASSCKVGP